MMRALLYIFSALVAVGFGFWAYQVNYETQAALRRVHELNEKIADEREAVTMLKADWVWLSRPERLAELVRLYADDLKLVPLQPGHFGTLRDIENPAQPLPEGWDGLTVADIEVHVVRASYPGPRPHRRPDRALR